MAAGGLFELGDVGVEEGEADLFDVASDWGGLLLRHVSFSLRVMMALSDQLMYSTVRPHP